MSLKNLRVPDTSTVTSAPTNHIIVIDCSGSMYSDLPKIRTHLKNKIPTMVKTDDTLTVIWFSGRNQFGVLFEAAKVAGLTDLSQINATIDRYLTTVGLTGFKQPLEEVLAVTKRVTGTQHSMLFLSDGYDNEWSRKEIMDVCTSLSGELVSAAFVEYGFYADSEMLGKMAEEVGGSLVQASDFSKYAFQLDNIKTLSFGKRLTVDVPALDASKEFVIGHTSTGFVVAKPVNGKVSLPSNTVSYSFFEKSIKGTPNKIGDAEACGVIAALIQRGMADEAIELASQVGDIALYRSLENAFSKQDLMRVVDQAEKLSTGETKMFTSGKQVGMAPAPDAYNVLELLMDLADQPDNKLVLSHPDFVYNSISKKRETADVNGFVPKFKDISTVSIADITNITFDSDRPNASILVKRLGTVTLPDNEYGFGNSFNSFIWRNYAIIKDGIVNVSKLPVMLTKTTYDKLTSRGLELTPFKVGQVYVIDVGTMPVINRSMVSGVDITTFFELCVREYKLECQQKYLKTLIDKPEVGEKFASMYGTEAALFLKEYGITEGGFSPKTVAAEEQSDKYVAKMLTTKLAGLSSIPKIEDVKANIASGKKLTPSQQLLADAIRVVDKAIETGMSAESWLTDVKYTLKSLRAQIIRNKFGVIIGRKWFTGSVGYDDNVRELDIGLPKPVKCEVVLTEKLV